MDMCKDFHLYAMQCVPKSMKLKPQRIELFIIELKKQILKAIKPLPSVPTTV